MWKGYVCLCIAVGALSSRVALASDVESDLKQGQLLQSQGRLEEAERQFQTALMKAAGTPEQPDIQVSALSNLASVEIDLSQTETAARLYDRAIAVLRNSGGDHGPAIENVRVRLAELYLESGATETAGRLVDAVIASQRARRNADTPGAALAFDVRACVYAYRKEFRKAGASEREALKILDHLGRQNEPEYAIGALHLGSFLNSQKRPVEGLPYIQKALGVLRGLAVRQPAMEGASEVTLASIYSAMGRTEEALNAAEAAFLTTQNYYGADHPNTAMMLLAKAAVLRKIGQKAAARRAQKEAERIMKANRGTGVSGTMPVEALFPR